MGDGQRRHFRQKEAGGFSEFRKESALEGGQVPRDIAGRLKGERKARLFGGNSGHGSVNLHIRKNMIQSPQGGVKEGA